MARLLLATAALIGCASAYTDEALADQITSLPGAPDVAFNQFSGYLPIDEASGLQYFYWFVEREGETSPADSPVALWTNGGPGCSGLTGFMTEQGPFRPNANGTLDANEYAWNKAANMLFVEQPVGVGFSYSTTRSDYHGVGDADAAADNYQLILQFLKRFPEYATNPFYITAESYGGHYMPTLANYIVEHNSDGAINFQGFAVGNPYTDPVENAKGLVDTLYGHQMMPRPAYERWAKVCKNGERTGRPCTVLTNGVYKWSGNINPYALDYPVCLADDGTPRLTPAQARLAYATSEAAKRDARGVMPDLAEALGLPGDPEGYDPCVDDYATAYLNRADVKAAIHANPEIEWAECSQRTPYGTLVYNYSNSADPMEPYYLSLIDGGYNLSLLVYSGDDDSVCGTIGTQSWIWDLGPATVGNWSSWSLGGQVAGYVQRFAGLSFATVHGAGHEVPTYKPAQALELISAYFDKAEWLMGGQ